MWMISYFVRPALITGLWPSADWLVTITLGHDGDLAMTDPQPDQVPRPGDMTPVAGWPSCPVRVRLYRDGPRAEEGLSLTEVPDRLAADGDVIIWVDLLQPSGSDLERLAQILDLHPLAVEDALQSQQRTKLDRYRSHLFANLYAVTFDTSDTRLEAEELSAFILPRILVTVRKDPVDLEPVLARWDAAEPDIDMGHLVYGLLDALVDGQFDAAIQLSDMIQDFEDHIFDRAYRDENKSRGFDLRKCLIQMRRFAAPMREVAGRFPARNAARAARSRSVL
jgi:magnesium transporter